MGSNIRNLQQVGGMGSTQGISFSIPCRRPSAASIRCLQPMLLKSPSNRHETNQRSKSGRKALRAPS
jgi:hypothetical protein